MNLIEAIPYLAFSILVFDFIQLIPLNKVFLPRAILLIVLIIANGLIIAFSAFIPWIGIVVFLIITTCFTIAARGLKFYFNRNLQNLFKSKSLLIDLTYFFNLDWHSWALYKMKPVFHHFLKFERIKAMEILFKISKKKLLEKYMPWQCDLIQILFFTNQLDILKETIEKLEIDYSKPGLQVNFVFILVRVLCQLENFEEAAKALKYMDTYYSEGHFKSLYLITYLLFYSMTGCVENFNRMITEFPELEQSQMLSYWKASLYLKAGHKEMAVQILERFQESIPANEYYMNNHIKQLLSNPEMLKPVDPEITQKILPIYPVRGKRPLTPVTLIPEKKNGIIILCCIVFFISFFQFISTKPQGIAEILGLSRLTSLDLIQAGALYNEYIHQGQWIRFITHIFLHIGWLHLIINVITLYSIGRFVEQVFGSLNLMIISIVSGIAGGIATFIFTPTSVSVGFSGAAFGLVGSVLVFYFWNRKTIDTAVFNRFIINLVVVIGINVVLAFQYSQINQYAHAAGFITGVLLSLLLLFLHTRYFRLAPVFETAKIIFIACICFSLIIFWPPLIRADYFTHMPLTEKVLLNSYTITTHSSWRIIDHDKGSIRSFLTNTSIIILKENPFVGDTSLLQTELQNSIDIQQKDPKSLMADYSVYNFLKQNKNGWFSYSVKRKKHTASAYDYITFYFKQFPSSVCTVLVSQFDKYREKELPVIESFLNSIGE